MALIKVYYDLMSQPARGLYMFLKINKIPFEPKPIALRKGEHHTDSYKKINPFSLVPVVDDNGFILTESCAIFRYLSAKFNVAEHWYPRKDLKAQARVDEYLHWQHHNTRFNASMVFRNLVILPRAQERPVNLEEYEQYKYSTSKVVGYIADHFLKDKPYLCGQEISVADILGVCELMQLYACCEEDIYQSNHTVNAWVERVKLRLGPTFTEGNAMPEKVRKAYPMMKNQFAKFSKL